METTSTGETIPTNDPHFRRCEHVARDPSLYTPAGGGAYMLLERCGKPDDTFGVELCMECWAQIMRYTIMTTIAKEDATLNTGVRPILSSLMELPIRERDDG